MTKILASMMFVFSMGCGAGTPEPDPQPAPDGGTILPPLECAVEGSRCHPFDGPQCCATTPTGIAMICNHGTCAPPQDLKASCSMIGAPCDTVADSCQMPFKAMCVGYACTPDI